MSVATHSSERIRDDFTEFVKVVEPRLRVALGAALGREAGREATAEALAWAWEHRERLSGMDNPAGYLYRVGRTSVRWRRRRKGFEYEGSGRIPEVEPALFDALRDLTERQRTVVFLVHGMEWTRGEVADVLGISVHSVGSHLERGLAALRSRLGVNLR